MMNESQIREIVQRTVAARTEARTEMTLAAAERLADAVLAEAKRIGVRAVVCVADSGGNPKLVKCMDGAYLASYDIAVNKAYTSVALQTSTVQLKELAQPGASLYGIQFTNGGKIVVFGGGDLLTGKDGKLVGGLGVSGGTEQQDTALSAYGKQYFEMQTE